MSEELSVNTDVGDQKIKRLTNWLSLKPPIFDEVVSVIRNSYFTKMDFINHIDFDKHRYSRIIIYKDENIEVVLICWLKGQGSVLHNHSDSKCFYLCIHGELFDEVFNKSDNNMLHMYKKGNYILYWTKVSHV